MPNVKPETIQFVAIPSNRVNVSYGEVYEAIKKSDRSQSPQIGSMFLTVAKAVAMTVWGIED